MKTKHLRGMRDIPTVQGVHQHSLPGTREQTVAEIARLEHEKARLEREMGIWRDNQARTQKRILQVAERLASLQAMLDPEPANPASRRNKGRKGSDGGDAGDRDQSQGWQEVSLEY
jgi:hypothetical protein